ncbi:MAG: folate family ECF transporter S component [Alphaproteobacteria bacterium]|nr:folate family ECF transporter S component [Alphaproteobacteria bacterium]
MQNSKLIKQNFWKEALKNCRDVKMIAVAAVLTALRIAVKAFSIPIIPDALKIEFTCYFDALGSMIYGPFLALLSGAISDTLGAVIFPQGGSYFLPYIIPEMLGSFIYALLLWNRKKVTVSRIVFSRFAVNIICNIILNSLVLKLYFIKYMSGKAVAFINLVRISKNLILFPLEGILIAIIITAALPGLKRLGVVSNEVKGEKVTPKSIIIVAVLLLVSIGLVVFYKLYLANYLNAHNFNWLYF